MNVVLASVSPLTFEFDAMRKPMLGVAKLQSSMSTLVTVSAAAVLMSTPREVLPLKSTRWNFVLFDDALWKLMPVPPFWMARSLIVMSLARIENP